MKYVKEIVIIFGITMVGELLNKFIPLTHSHRRNRAANIAQHVFLFLLYESRIPFPETGYCKTSSLPPVSGYLFTKRKGRKSVLNIRL